MKEKEYSIVQELYEENISVVHNITPAHVYDMRIMHFHDGFEIFLSMSDNCVYAFEKESYRLDRGGLILVNNGELHRTCAPPDDIYDRYIISFIPDFLSDLGMEEELFQGFFNRPAGRPRCVQLTEEQLDELVEAIELLRKYLGQNRHGEIMLRKLALAQVIILCNGYFNGGALNPQQLMVSKRLQPVFDYIKENIGENLSLDKMAEYLFISKAQLIRLFKSETGMTPNEYITLYRIMKSREYLAKGDSVLKVCERVGYADESHFIRTFKKIMGITPKKYGMLKRD